MTLITIAPGIRVLRRHPDRDVLIVEGLGEYATLFIESIPGGWCVVNGEAATKRIYEQVRQCEEFNMDNENSEHPTPLPCPFCGGQPEILPKDPSVSGSAWGRVSCLNEGCQARPAVEHHGDGDFPHDDSTMTSVWNKRQAVLGWNRRATSSATINGEDSPNLLLEVRRLQADNRRLSDNLRHVSTALGEHLRPGQTPECAITRIVGDLAACEKERDAYRSSAELAADRANRAQAERDELRLTLLAEQGDIRGAPKGWARTGWLWWCPLGAKDCQAEVRRSNTHPDGEPWYWALYTPTITAEGYAPTAREAMKRADKAFQEKA